MKPYGTERSVRSTLTNAEIEVTERAGLSPFVLAEPDPEPLPLVTRLPVVIDRDGVHAVDPRTGEVAA